MRPWIPIMVLKWREGVIKGGERGEWSRFRWVQAESKTPNQIQYVDNMLAHCYLGWFWMIKTNQFMNIEWSLTSWFGTSWWIPVRFCHLQLHIWAQVAPKPGPVPWESQPMDDRWPPPPSFLVYIFQVVVIIGWLASTRSKMWVRMKIFFIYQRKARLHHDTDTEMSHQALSPKNNWVIALIKSYTSL